jgi:parvulin-like peptidyl-prolyl isomerase
MADIDSLAFLTVGNRSISLGQALRYLQRSGKLVPFVSEIVGQHLIFEEIQSRSDLQVGVAELEAAVQTFRANQQLTDADRFQQWLSNQGFTYASFCTRITDELKVEKLKAQISEPNLSTYFTTHHKALDQIKLTYIVTTDKNMADEFRKRINRRKSNFEAIATECINQVFLKDSDKVSLKKETLRREQLREELKEPLAAASVGDLIGPIEVEQRWWIIKVEDIQDAKLEGDLKQQLEVEFFKQWLNERIQQSPVQLAAN